MENWTRRSFFLSALAGGIAASANKVLGAVAPNGGKAVGDGAAAKLRQSAPVSGKRPCIISAHNGLKHLDAGMQVLRTTGDTMDAVLAVVSPWRTIPTTIRWATADCRTKTEWCNWTRA